jgi:hypothetical protein
MSSEFTFGLSPLLGRARRSLGLPVGALLFAVASLGLAACGGPSASKTMSVSPASGPPGTVVTVSGKAGSGCNAGSNWFGFDFHLAGGKGPATRMTTPVLKNGSWSVSFAIPSYLGGTDGGPTKPGRYQLVAGSCRGHVVAQASFRVTSGSPPALSHDYFVGIVTTIDGQGYWLVRADGAVSAFGDAHSYGSPSASQAQASGGVVGMARTYDAHGYWLATADGAVFNLGDAHAYGSLAAKRTKSSGPIVGIAATSDGKGYWLLSAGGEVYGFGDAHPEGSPGSRFAPYDAIGTRPAGGYVITAADNGAVFVYPGNQLASGGRGNEEATTLVGTAVIPSGNGAWQAGMNGGVSTWPSAGSFYGSLPGQGVAPSAPVTAIAGTPDGAGYWLLGAKGRVYTFGDAKVFATGS